MAIGEHFTRLGQRPEDLVMIPIVKVNGDSFVRKAIEEIDQQV